MNYYDFAVDVVTRAGEKLRAASRHIVVSHKGADLRDMITDADLKVNTFLVSEIKQAFPEHRIYSEEGAGTSTTSEYEWTIDPIDGSANFSRGIPHFAVCVGLLKNGIPIVGAVYNPITNELFSFEEGQGAFLNGAAIHVTDIANPGEALGILVVGHQAPLWDWGAAVYRSFLEHLKKMKVFGSSALDLCFIAAGRADVVVYGTLTTRDIACAIGIVRAAGGEVYTPDGAPVELSVTRQTVVATANRALFENTLPLLHADLLSGA
ncbi:inositol monophosphatase [Candidatus Kaiserbacteria bacterium]|nr:inositol monophosphatase [Candidatus Kaiserbacteria bacterium]